MLKKLNCSPLILSLTLGLFCICTKGFADHSDNPPPLTGWTHSETLPQDSAERHGVILPGADVDYSSPAVGELDGDSADGLETVFGSADGTITVVKANGSILWSTRLPSYSCTHGDITNRLYATPAIGELYGDGVAYVVAGYGGFAKVDCDGGVVALIGSSGELAWKFSLKSFSKKEHFWTQSHGVFSSPALADTDGDGKLEIGFGSFDRNVYLLNADGSLRWYYHAADTVWSSPAFVRIPGKSKLAMIIGTDISANSAFNPPITNGGYVYAFDTSRRKNSKKINFLDKSGYFWQTHFPQTIYSSPIVADVMASNPGKEIIVGSGCFFPEHTNKKTGAWVKIIRPRDGKVLKTLNAPACFSSSLAVGDLDGDGILEIVATVNGSTNLGGDGLGRIVAWKASSATPIWQVTPYDGSSNNPFLGHIQSPTIADIDGNGSLEVLVATTKSVGIFAGFDGTPLTFQQASGSTSLSLFTSANLSSTPTVADLDGDGELEVIIGGAHQGSGGHGVGYAWTGFSSILGSTAGTQAPYATPWPMFRGNAKHTAVFGD